MTAPISKNTRPNAAPVFYQAESYALLNNRSIGHETEDKWDAQTPFCTGARSAERPCEYRCCFRYSDFSPGLETCGTLSSAMSIGWRTSWASYTWSVSLSCPGVYSGVYRVTPNGPSGQCVGFRRLLVKGKISLRFASPTPTAIKRVGPSVRR